jgi:hypothetical protein
MYRKVKTIANMSQKHVSEVEYPKRLTWPPLPIAVEGVIPPNGG